MFDDPSGLARLPHTRGFGRFLAFLGFFVMLAGLGVFAFAILSTFASFSGGGVSRMPAILPIGFGIAAAGAILYQVGLVLGMPRDGGDGADIIYVDNEFSGIDQSFHNEGGDATFYGDYAPSVIIATRLESVDRLYDAVERLGLPDEKRTEAEAAIGSLRRAVDTNAEESELSKRLGRVANVLYAAGALTGGATTVLGGLVQVAKVLGPAGRAIYDWLTVDDRR